MDGAGTKWTNNGTLNVGENGNGVMSVTGGGEVSNAYGYYIGHWHGSTGEVTVDGAGSALHNGRDLRVGYEGDGRLNITGGGTVTVGWDTWVAVNSGSSGTIHLDNGTLTTGGRTLCLR